MTLPNRYLTPQLWASFTADIIHSSSADGTHSTLEPETIYTPVVNVPLFVAYRTSDREKRLESDLQTKVVTEGDWGVLHEVTGGGSHVGFVLEVKPGHFAGAVSLPDSVHFMHRESIVDAPAKSVHNHRMLKVMSFDKDLYVVTKTRWFRNRNNPKFLGFSKDER